MIEKKESFRVSAKERMQLLGVARRSVEVFARQGVEPDFDKEDFSGVSCRPCGAFVTLHENGLLRGCIGFFESDQPLWRTVREMALAAAFRDPRFPPLSEGEVESVDFEISVLSPLRKITEPGEIIPGKHGIYIRKGSRSGTFLPQVAVETGWSREEFLGHCSRDKAGLGWDGWKTAELFVYTAEVFGEKDGTAE